MSSPEPFRQQGLIRRFPTVTIAFVFIAAMVLAAGPVLSYPVVTGLCVLSQVLIAGLVWSSNRRVVSVVALIMASWFVYYTVRMVTIVVATNATYDHPVVAGAGDALRSEIWIGTTCVTAMFASGLLWGQAIGQRREFRPTVDSAESILRVIGYVGVIGTGSFNLLGVQSGILGNILQSYLFALAGLSYISAQRRSYRLPDVLLLVAAVSLGVFVNFKEPAVMALLAWSIGYFAAGRRIRIRAAVAAGLIALIMFSGIQAQRIAQFQSGAPGIPSPTQFATNMVDGFTRFNLAYGVVEEQSGLGGLMNPVLGVLNRVKAQDALFALRSRVPQDIEFQSGKSIVEPLLSALPIPLPLDLDFTQLSLGRYFNLTFWTMRPDTDQSSQALTVVGDLYLNWGWTGAVFGMTLFGSLVGFLDRKYAATTLAGTGILAYALLPLISFDRNLSYQIVTVAIRLAVALVIVRLISQPKGRTHQIIPTSRIQKAATSG